MPERHVPADGEGPGCVATGRSTPVSARCRRFRLIVFDWDGTLVDSTQLIASSIRAACRDLGLPVPSRASARHVIGLGLEDALRLVAPALPLARYGELALRYRHHFVLRDAEIPLFPGVRPMLQELEDGGALLAIATGKSRRGLDRALQQQAQVYAKLFDIFDRHSKSISRVTFWGISDRRSLRGRQRPLLFDAQLQPKPALQAILNVSEAN